MARIRNLTLLLPTLLGGGLACAADRDPLLSQLAGSSALAPRFEFMQTVSPMPLTSGLPGSIDPEEPEAGLAAPALRTGQRLDASHTLLQNALAIEWQHGLGASHRIGLSALYGGSTRLETDSTAASGSAAALSWSALVGGDSRLTGQLFAGDEDYREGGSGYSARRYYGLLLEGSYTLWRDHSPFASLVWQRSDYQAAENGGNGAATLPRYEQQSRFAAGWNWQVQPNWGVRAEANYRFQDETIDPLGGDRTQLYFSTQYGFR